MNGFLDIYSLIFLVIAVAIFWRLRSVLGRRTGHERPPYDPFSRPDPSQGRAPLGESNDNVVTLPRPSKPPGETGVDEGELERIAPRSSALYTALKAIVLADRDFEAQAFLAGARTAYEMIIAAFAQGDRDTLKPLLSSEVFSGFKTAIEAREARGERVETTLISLEKAEIVEAALKGSTAQITVRFVSKLISATYDANGTVIDGDPAKIIEVTDIWTFAREVRARDPNWKLIATENEG